ncbi:hypothetical protein [Micromonospora chokoriensis]
MANILIRFTAEDAERLGMSEVSFNPQALRFPEIRLLKNEAGLSLPEYGALLADRSNFYYLLGILAWLALYRAGVRIPFAELDIDTRGIEVSGDEAAEDPNSSAPDGASSS